MPVDERYVWTRDLLRLDQSTRFVNRPRLNRGFVNGAERLSGFFTQGPAILELGRYLDGLAGQGADF